MTMTTYPIQIRSSVLDMWSRSSIWTNWLRSPNVWVRD
jgi:hypothetical protein